MIWVLLACRDTGDDSDPDPEATGPGFHIMVEDIPTGIVLSATEQEDELVMVGGVLGTGPGVLLRYDGTRICAQEDISDAALWWIDGDGEKEWYAVGEGGAILHSLDGTLTREDVPTDSPLYGVWIAPDGDVWAAGGDPWKSNMGEVWRKTKGKWALVDDTIPGVIFKVWGGWFVGDGVAYQLDGENLVAHPPPRSERLINISGSDVNTDLVAVGGLGSPVALRWDGNAWSDFELPAECAPQPLSGVWATEPGEVWLAGHYGTTMGVVDGEWSCSVPPITQEHFHAVVAFGDEMLFLGGNLFSSDANHGLIGRWGTGRPTLEVTPCP